ncbi:MAG: sigma-70 family RNA polymerase sigma factor [Deltaproteobacteria bacterium]|nr:sigma-70 family RNA polymerase sigma factor [Deltaproteobacteria bacterium]
MDSSAPPLPEHKANGDVLLPLPMGGLDAPTTTGAPFDWASAARTWNRRVVVHLLSRGLAHDDADEVAQRTWTRLIALERAGGLPRIELPGLALAQARFLAATLRRERARDRIAPDADPAVLELVIDEGSADAERRVLARDRVERALAELERAPASALRVFRHLLDEPPPTHAQIASALGLSEQRVRQIVCETRARLRRALDDAHHDLAAPAAKEPR